MPAQARDAGIRVERSRSRRAGGCGRSRRRPTFGRRVSRWLCGSEGDAVVVSRCAGIGTPGRWRNAAGAAGVGWCHRGYCAVHVDQPEGGL